MPEITLKFNVRPQAHQSVKLGRNGIAYQPAKVHNFKSYIRKLTKDQLTEDFNIISAGTPITVEYLHYQFKYLSNTAKKNRYVGLVKATKPDLLDNLNKAFIDALEGIVFEQDQNIVEVKSLKKFYGPEDCIMIKLSWGD
jgi:Holliday junction resolvase RusA-like endonuclease